MKYIEHYLTIDMLREKLEGAVYIRQAGIGHKLHVTLTAGMEPVALPESSEGLVMLAYTKPNGTKSDVMMSVENNRASVVIPRAAVDTVGTTICEVRVYDSTAGTWWTSPRITIVVQSVEYDAAAQQTVVSDPTV